MTLQLLGSYGTIYSPDFFSSLLLILSTLKANKVIRQKSCSSSQHSLMLSTSVCRLKRNCLKSYPPQKELPNSVKLMTEHSRAKPKS